MSLPGRLGRWRHALWGARYVVVSLGLHLGLFAYLAALPRRSLEPSPKPVELELVEIEPPKPPEPKPEEPPPPKARPPPIKVARTEKPPPPPDEPPPPPPPNDTPPPEPSKKPVPLVVGISMSSTTTAGGFAAPVGNTMYGKTDDTAKDPGQVQAYSAPKYAPLHTVDSEPKVEHEEKIPYPEEAKRAGVEGQVILAITVDLTGQVVGAKLVSGPGYGLNEAALKAIRRFRFRPAMKGGEPVSTEMRYTYTFLLD